MCARRLNPAKEDYMDTTGTNHGVIADVLRSLLFELGLGRLRKLRGRVKRTDEPRAVENPETRTIAR
jgi:hypothetical protein